MTWLVRPGDALERKAEPRVTASERGIEDEDLGRMKKSPRARGMCSFDKVIEQKEVLRGGCTWLYSSC